MTVEGKMPGCQPSHCEPRFGIAEVGGERPLFPEFTPCIRSLMQDNHRIAPPTQGGLQRIEQPFTNPFSLPFKAQRETINDSLNGMAFRLEEFDRLGAAQIKDLSVDAQTDKSLATGTVDHITEFTNLISHQGGQQHQAGSLGPGENHLGDLLR